MGVVTLESSGVGTMPQVKRQRLEQEVASGIIMEEKTADQARTTLRKIAVRVDGVVKEMELGVRAQDVLPASAGAAHTVAARVDNEVVALSRALEGSTVSVEPVALRSSDGVRTLVETLRLLLKAAKQRCEPGLAITLGKPIGAAYFCQLADRASDETREPSEELLRRLEAAMREMIDASLPMRYRTVSTCDAIERMSQTGRGFSAQMLADLNENEVELVEFDGLYHVPRAPIMPNSSFVPKDSFKLSKFKDGFLLEHQRFNKGTGAFEFSSYSAAAADLLYNEFLERRRWTLDVGLSHIAELNAWIREGKAKKMIQAAEANCDRQFVEMTSQIQARGDVRLVLIAGPTSSGKTTFAKRLQVQLEAIGFKPFVLSVDSFYKAWRDITAEGPQKVDWESMDSLNLSQLNDVLLSLLAGKETVIPEYDMKSSTPMDQAHWTKMQLATKRPVIIMEGIHCLNPALTAAVPKAQKFHIAIAPIPALQLDASHVLSSSTVRLLRRMVRDYLTRGRPVLSTLRQWPGVVAGEVSNIYPHQHNADAVMNSEIAYEMSALKVHAEPMLRTVRPSEAEYSEVRRLLRTLAQFTALPTNIIPPQSLIREFIGGSWYYDFGGWYKDY